MIEYVKENLLVFLVVGVFFTSLTSGLLYSVKTTHENSMNLVFMEKLFNQYIKRNIEYQNKTTETLKIIKQKLILVLEKNDIKDLITDIEEDQPIPPIEVDNIKTSASYAPNFSEPAPRNYTTNSMVHHNKLLELFKEKIETISKLNEELDKYKKEMDMKTKTEHHGEKTVE